MFNATAAHSTVTGYDAAEAQALAFEADFGADWESREQFGERFLSERDFALDSPDADAVSDEDWAAFLEMAWVDPAERWL